LTGIVAPYLKNIKQITFILIMSFCRSGG